MELLFSALSALTVDHYKSWVSSTGCFILYETTTCGRQNPFVFTGLL